MPCDQMARLRLISADSHVVEPADLWVERLDRVFRDRAPGVVPNEKRPGVSLVAPGIPPFPIASLWAIGKSGTELARHTGRLPHFMYRMDHAYEKYWSVAGMRWIEMKPSDFLRRQLRATFQDDPIGGVTYEYFGADNYMWASDFPHSGSTRPNSRKVVRTDFARVPEDVTRKMGFGNAAGRCGVSLD